MFISTYAIFSLIYSQHSTAEVLIYGNYFENYFLYVITTNSCRIRITASNSLAYAEDQHTKEASRYAKYYIPRRFKRCQNRRGSQTEYLAYLCKSVVFYYNTLRAVLQIVCIDAQKDFQKHH